MGSSRRPNLLLPVRVSSATLTLGLLHVCSSSAQNRRQVFIELPLRQQSVKSERLWKDLFPIVVATAVAYSTFPPWLFYGWHLISIRRRPGWPSRRVEALLGFPTTSMACIGSGFIQCALQVPG